MKVTMLDITTLLWNTTLVVDTVIIAVHFIERGQGDAYFAKLII